ncbi:MAG TPA: apolipoprotein N-acyltransferase [Candidatus Acidoferrales bacterium]|jgi:apolipoprotein N-acyltransferase|nr:apolipoprotein N-acyltransferase [Candidatus Acidoferrales bacterium]
MTFSWYTRVLLALASGLTLALAFPNYNLPLLAWISITLLVLASFGARPRVAPLYGFLHALVFYPVCLPWMDIVMQQYGDVGPWTSAGILGLVGIAGGIICALFSWGVALASRRGAAFACALAPFLWVALEFARGNLPIFAFPWNLIGYAASGNLALVQLTSVTGIYGLSFVVAGYGALLAYAILSGRQRAWKSLIATTAALILIAIGGPHFVPAATPRFVAHLVQTDFAQSYSYPPDWMRIHAGDLDQLEQISIDSARQMPGLIVWPEVPAPFSLQDPDFAARARRIARDSDVDFLVGVEDWKHDSAGKWIATNSAVLLDPQGQRLFTYDKIHLVPFGEYVPLRKWLTFAGKLTADIGDFTPGTAYSVGRLPMVPAYVPSAGAPFSVFICYEGVLPGAVRRFTANGAELLINISNDGWFGRSAAPAQHVMMARVRAVENRRWLLRDTNNGFTVDVDPYGRTVAALATDIRGQLDAPYDFRSDLTLYARFGNWLAWLCVLSAVALVIFSLLPKRI